MKDVEHEWDPKKAKPNIAKHGVAFADAVSVFSGDSAITIEDESPGEERFVTMGMDGLGLSLWLRKRGEKKRYESFLRGKQRKESADYSGESDEEGIRFSGRQARSD